MSSHASEIDVLVVGAGLGGLLAARNLQAGGLRVRVIDKARGVGGRLATRRLESSTGDHGAQFFTAHDPVFRGLVTEWEAAGVARRWSTGFAVQDGSIKDNGVARYCGVAGMTGIPKHLAEGLEVQLQAKAARVELRPGGWTTTTEDGTAHASRALLLTPPVPQSLALLAAGEVPLSARDREALEPIDYARSFTLLARLAGASRIPAPGGMWMEGEPLFWLGDNRLKGLPSDSGTVVTIHAGQEYSLAHWGRPDLEVGAAILAAAMPWLGSEVQQTHLHRWRYGVPLRVHPDACLVAEGTPPLVFAGDAFGGPRVEAAALSGLAAGEALRQALTP